MGDIVLVDEPREKKEPMIGCTFINDDRPCKFQPVVTDRGICYGFNNAPMEEVFHSNTLTETMGAVYNISGKTGVGNNRNNPIQNTLIVKLDMQNFKSKRSRMESREEVQ